MNPVPLLPNQPVTQQGDLASRELREVIDRLIAKVLELEATVADHETRIVALEP